MPDWASALSAIGTGVQGLAFVATTFAVYKGLKGWRDQQLGKRRVEVAEQTLTIFYELNEAISSARFPLSFGSEGKAWRGTDNDPERSGEIVDSYYVPVERLSRHQELFAKARTLRLLCRAYFGDRAEKSFEDIENSIARVRTGA